MARPKTGGTPDNLRQAKTLAELRKAGGDKVAVNLQAPAMADLATVMSARGYRAKKEAITEALKMLASSIKAGF